MTTWQSADELATVCLIILKIGIFNRSATAENISRLRPETKEMVDNGIKERRGFSLSVHFCCQTAEIVITFRLPIEREGVGEAFVSVEGLSAQLDC